MIARRVLPLLKPLFAANHGSSARRIRRRTRRGRCCSWTITASGSCVISCSKNGAYDSSKSARRVLPLLYPLVAANYGSSARRTRRRTRRRRCWSWTVTASGSCWRWRRAPTRSSCAWRPSPARAWLRDTPCRRVCSQSPGAHNPHSTMKVERCWVVRVVQGHGQRHSACALGGAVN